SRSSSCCGRRPTSGARRSWWWPTTPGSSPTRTACSTWRTADSRRRTSRARVRSSRSACKRRTVAMQTTRPPRPETIERRLPQPADPDLGRRRFPARTVLVLFGLALLTASVVGTGWVLRSHAHDSRGPETAPPVENVPGYTVGRVDVEGRIPELY